MKKKFFRSVLFPLLFAVLLGFYGAKIVYGFNRVKQSVSNVSHNAYAIQYGVYTSADTLNKTMSNIYIGFTTDSKNLTKIRNVYDELGIDVYIKEVFINNDEFINTLEQFDVLLDNVSSNVDVLSITGAILSSYDELVLGN